MLVIVTRLFIKRRRGIETRSVLGPLNDLLDFILLIIEFEQLGSQSQSSQASDVLEGTRFAEAKEGEDDEDKEG
ncbi:hypothetical protein CDL15_Pgr016290 [Punica granatum]|uniref:Uncharacterized protein n=1 Tax=Punica granatum TaxID=22663 RepID=A0A218W702_PUNGR|nr:hypothetical protein CDL15_Pgr016290 [Punica granatum]PKI71910.1 hypothetical protein CRG98_007678 [Punica granatum]